MSMKTVIVKKLCKSYGHGEGRVDVLKNLNFEIEKGEVVAVIGKSGSGKSTMLSLLSGLDLPDSGEILIENKDIASMNEKELTLFRSSHIGIVFQQFHLVSTLTAYENILLPLELLKRPEADKRVTSLLEAVGLSHRANHLPSELSGGEAQRIAIARAMAITPSILFADEPSGNLDEETGEKVMELLFKMVEASGTTMILVTHDLDLARKCSRILHLEHGSLL